MDLTRLSIRLIASTQCSPSSLSLRASFDLPPSSVPDFPSCYPLAFAASSLATILSKTSLSNSTSDATRLAMSLPNLVTQAGDSFESTLNIAVELFTLVPVISERGVDSTKVQIRMLELQFFRTPSISL